MRKSLEYLIDLVYREKEICFICGYKGAEVRCHICFECREKLKFVGYRRCGICGKYMPHSDQGKIPICTDCELHPKHFEKGASPLVYTGEIRGLIHQFKYHDKTYLKKLFSELMIEELMESDMADADIIMGVPLHRKRENKRGYNQAELISSYIGKKLGINSGEGILVRTKETGVQKELGRSQRARNLENAFYVREPDRLKGKTVILVDDIYTTGATLNESAKELRKNGAKKINVITLATAVEKKKEE